MGYGPCKNPSCNSYGAPHPNCMCYPNYSKGGMVGSFCDSNQKHNPGCSYAMGGMVKEKGMNFSNFKKVDENDQMAILKHPDGHQITVAKSGLSNDMRKRLMDLPLHKVDGGDVKDPEEPTLFQKIGSGIGGVINKAWDPVLGIQPQQQTMSQVSESPVMTPEEEKLPSKYKLNLSPPIASNEPVPGLIGSPVAPSPAPMNDPLKAYGQIEKGLRDEAKIAEQKGLQEAAAYVGHAEAMDKIVNTFNEKHKGLQDEIQNVTQDIKDHPIDNGRFLKNMSTGSKIMTALGMLVSGISGNQQNSVSKFLDDEIERDVQEQKSNLGRKDNLLSALNRQLGDLNQSTEMLKALRLNQLAATLGEIGAKSAGPQQQALIQQKIGALNQARDEKLSAIAMQQLFMKGTTGGSEPFAGMNIEAFPEDLRQRAEKIKSRVVTLPGGGIGIAKTDDDAKEIKDAYKSKKSFDNKIDEMIELRKKYGGEFFDREAVARAKQLSKQALLEYKNMAKLGVLSSSDKDIIEAIIPEDPLSFRSALEIAQGQDSVLNKLMQFKKDSDNDFSNTVQARVQNSREYQTPSLPPEKENKRYSALKGKPNSSVAKK